MPEQWQSGLRKLRSLQPPEETWTHVLEGPRRPASPPPRRQRIMAAVVAIAVFVAAGAFVVRAFRTETNAPAPANPMSLRLPVVLAFDPPGQEEADPPTATLTLGERSLREDAYASLWDSPGRGTVAAGDDYAPPRWNPSHALGIPTGTRVVVRGEPERVLATVAPVTDGTVEYPTPTVRDEVFPGRGVIDAPPGRYFLELSVDWEDPDHANYSFPIEVIPAGEAEPIPNVAGDPADVAHISCTDEGTRTSTPVVRAQPDGVHIEVEDLSGRFDNLGIQESGDPIRQLLAGIDGIDDAFTRPIMPGRVYVQCLGHRQQFTLSAVQDGSIPIDAVAFSVVDPDGFWVSTRLSCPLYEWEPVGDSIYSPRLETVADRIRKLPGVRATDTIEEAAYPADDDIEYRIVRGADVMARFEGAGPNLDGLTCRGSGVTQSNP